jgi:uncharacterized protein YndB with AHSA1/START domain
MAPIVESIEISRPPDDVFSYVTDASALPEWQEGLVAVRPLGDGPAAVGSRVVMTRRARPRERDMTMELTELTRPSRWAARGVDGPVRPMVDGTIEPLGEADRSRVMVALDFQGHGIGKLLVPLVVRRQARAELPRNLRRLKERLESGA